MSTMSEFHMRGRLSDADTADQHLRGVHASDAGSTSLLFGGRPSPSQSEGTEKATQLERGDNSYLNMGSSSSNAGPELAIDTKRNEVQFVAAADLRAENATDKDPDSLYAWMVIFACLISLMLSIGINDAYGVYQQHYQLTEFPNATT
ncbi:hypothetical protein GGF42_006739, partial [Coemansia sp. RSA 2424]